MRIVTSILLLSLGTARAAAPVDAPGRPPGEVKPQRTAPNLDLPEWLRQVTGLHHAPSATPPPDDGRLHWTPVPFVVTNPLIGAGGGVALIGAFRLGESKATSWSSFVASAITTTNSQSSLNVRSDVRLPANDWILVGDWALSHFPNPAWGIGGDTPESNRTIVDRREVTFHETGYRRLAGPLYLGLGYYLDDYFGIVDQRATASAPTAFSAYGVGTAGRSVSSGATISLLWDTRDNPVNPWRGLYGLARYRWAPDEFGSERSWQSLWVEARGYVPLPRRSDTIALWGFAWTAFGRTPYLMLPAIGVDPEHRSGRGYVEGRHTGRDLVGFEAEYRFAIWQFVGGAVGGNVHSVSDREPIEGAPEFWHWHPAAVAGLRFTLDRRSLSNIALDFAARPGGFAVYLNANESF